MVNAEEYASDRVEPFWFDNPERHATAMREAVETMILTADDGQRFSALHLNRDFSDRPPIVSIASMFSGCNSPEQKYSAYQYAAAHPDRGVLKIDMPANGYSDALTDDQYKEIMNSQTLTRIAKSQATALRSHLPEAGDIIVVGDSLGARDGMDFVLGASTLGFHALKLIGFDPVGLEDRPSLNVSFSYFVREWRKSRRLYYNEANQRLSEAYEDAFKKQLAEHGFESDFSVAEVFRRDPRIRDFVFAKSPLATDTGVKSLETMLESQRDLTADLVIGGLSTICRQHKVVPMLEHLEEVFGDRLTHSIWPNDSHGMSLAPQQPRMAAFVKDTLDDSSIG
jgi:hypothetical protein